MQGYIPRNLEGNLRESLRFYPGVVLLGPRQCGKSTLARALLEGVPGASYLDLERPSDAARLRDPEAFFSLHRGKLICLDEIQRVQDLFPILRSIMDEDPSNGRFLLLGSASPDIIRESSETLAGRVAFLELTPFKLSEVADEENPSLLRKLWLRGGFPRSYLMPGDRRSHEWRENFVRTFLERDIPQLGVRIPGRTIERLWKMCAHLHGQILNSSKLGESLGVSHHAVRSYVDLLEGTFLLRVLPPYEPNLKKRLVKSPKIYVRDTGLLHTLLGIESHDGLLGHPIYGASWEGFVIENVLSELPGWKAFFYRTSLGTEIDLILEKGGKTVAVECKASMSPEVNRGFWNAIEDLKLKEAWVIAPVREAYPIGKNVTVSPLWPFLRKLRAEGGTGI